MRHIIQSHAQSVRTYVIGRTGFKLVGQALVSRMFKCDARNHFSTALVRRHFFQQGFAAVQDADAGRPIHFMAGENIEIAIQVLHVDGKMWRTLRPIHQHQGAVGVSYFRHALDGVHRTQDVAHVHHTNESRLRRKERFIRIHIQSARIVGDRDHF